LQEDIAACPACGGKLIRKGFSKSDFHSVFTDHKVSTRKQCCNRCDWKSIPSILSLFGTTMHPDLNKLQCEIAANKSYRDASRSLNKMSYNVRRINNHDRIMRTCDVVGTYIANHPLKEACARVDVKELMIQVDGGHVKSKQSDAKSFEVLTSVVFNPENIDYSYGYDKEEDGQLQIKYKRGKLLSKHCAASALSDHQASIKAMTLVAAKKQGLYKGTEVTALCDGADNCWKVIDSIEPVCKHITRILDWFHVGMKFKNISLKDKRLKQKAKNAKWHVWRGHPERALIRLEEMRRLVTNQKEKNKLSDLMGYIKNNEKHIVNYRERYQQGLVFTSQLAESNVESLINQRCKKQQHMRWTREGLHPLLQIRTAVASNDWSYQWESMVCGATLKAIA
jgi:hypothetical protein